MTRRQPPIALWIAVPLLVAVAAYARVLPGEFVLDDARVVRTNAVLGDPGVVLRSFPGALLHGGRPTTEVTFALSQAIGGGRPLAFHALNLLLHLAVVVLVFLFTREVLRLAGRGPSPGVAVAVAGIFALHPVQSQAVSYVSQRSEVLASGLYLSTLLLLLRAGGPGGGAARVLAAAGAVVTFTLGMGAKSIVVTAPLAWLLLVVLVPPAGPRREPFPWRRALVLLTPLAMVGALLVRGALRSVEGKADAGFSVPGLTPFTYFLTQWRAVATYVRLLAWPVGQNADWAFPASKGLAEPAVLASGAFLAAMLAGAALVWRRARSGSDPAAADGRAAAYGVVWFFLLLSPTSTFLPIADVLVEHRVYLASWGPFLVAVLAGARLLSRVAPGRRSLAMALAVGVVWTALAVALHRRNAVWESELAFWNDVVAKSPGKGRPYLGRGVAKGRNGDVPGAVADFRAGLERVPRVETALRLSLLNDLGAALIDLGKFEEAVAPLREAKELDPDEIAPRQGLALALWSTGDVDGAAAEASEVLARNPDAPLAARVLGLVRMARGDDAGAAPLLEQAVRARPTDPVVRYNLGAVYANLGRRAEACAAWKSVLALPAAGGSHEEARKGRSILGCPP